MNLKKILVILISGISATVVNGAENDSPVNLHTISMESRITYEQYQMPDKIQPLGVVGLHGLIDLTPWSYAGAGLYSAVNGESGGYFALALEGGIQHRLYQQLFFDGGIRVGGGGGRNTPVGGGLFYQPYLGLKYNLGNFRAGLYYSYINFVYGQIKSSHLGLELAVPITFNYATAYHINSGLHYSDINFPLIQYLGSSKNYIAAVGKIYFPNQGVTDNNGRIMNSHIGFLGIEAAHYFSQHVFVFFNMAGALHGRQNGYADELLGAGYRFPLLRSESWDGIIKLGAGSGGGGSINTGGGFIYSPMLGLEYHINPKLGVELNGGYVAAPSGNFKAKEASVLLKYYVSNAILQPVSRDTYHTTDAEKTSSFQAWRIRVLHQTYLHPRSESGEINPTMQLLGLNFDYFISRYFYLTGQTAFAYKGKQTGGYFSGMIGVGGETPTFSNNHVNLFAEALGGAAGGAGLDIGEGALVEPLVGINYQANDALGFQASIGRLIAIKGQFKPTILNFGIIYKFWGIS
jgi:hypothetical protein